MPTKPTTTPAAKAITLPPRGAVDREQAILEVLRDLQRRADELLAQTQAGLREARELREMMEMRSPSGFLDHS
jgi:hypothetical protein